MASPKDTIEEFVRTFIEAWPEKDAAALARFFSDEAVYCNGPLAPVRGRDAIVASIASFMEMGGENAVEIVHMLADGAIVMTERVDYLSLDGRTLSMPMMGLFEVHDGLITAWRDYFDLAQFTSQLP